MLTPRRNAANRGKDATGGPRDVLLSDDLTEEQASGLIPDVPLLEDVLSALDESDPDYDDKLFEVLKSYHAARNRLGIRNSKHSGIGTESFLQMMMLYFDGCTFSEIADLMGATLSGVSRQSDRMRISVDGIPFTWQQIKKIADPKRALAAVSRQRHGGPVFNYDEWAEKDRERAAERIEKARKAIVENLDDMDDKGRFVVPRSVADLAALEKTALLIRGEATEIREQRRTDATFLFQVVKLEVESALGRTSEVSSRILKGIERRVDAYEAADGDEKVAGQLLR